MVKFKIYWFNDTDKIHYFYLNHLYLHDRIAVIQPQTMGLLEFDLKPNHVPVVKQWANGNNLIWGKDCGILDTGSSVASKQTVQ